MEQKHLLCGVSDIFFRKHDKASEKSSVAKASLWYLLLSSRKHFSLWTQ